MGAVYETVVFKPLDIRQQKTVISEIRETKHCPSLLLLEFSGDSTAKGTQA